MKQRYALLTGLILLVLIFNSCCKSKRCKCNDEWGVKVDDCTPKHYGPYYLDSVKPYLWFKPGSWWVYKNSISGETDSIYTVYCDSIYTERPGTDKKWLTISYSSVNYKLRSDKYNADYYYQEQATYPDVTDFKYFHRLWRTAIFPTKAAPPAICFTHSFSKEFNSSFENILSSMDVQGKTYYEVAVIGSPNDESVQRSTATRTFIDKVKYYWARDYGIITMEVHSGNFNDPTGITEKWELINSHLIQ